MTVMKNWENNGTREIGLVTPTLAKLKVTLLMFAHGALPAIVGLP